MTCLSEAKERINLININELQKYLLALPDSEEGDHWGKRSYRIKNKIFAIIQNDGVTLTIKTMGEDRSIYTSMDPKTFSIPEAYSNLSYMHVNLHTVNIDELKGLIYKAWKSVAPKKLVKAYEEQLQGYFGGNSKNL